MKTIDAAGDDRISFTVRLQPRASRNEVAGWTETGELKIRVTAPPVENRANGELIKMLAQLLDVSRDRVEIAAGARSRVKRITTPQSCKNRLLAIPDI